MSKRGGGGGSPIGGPASLVFGIVSLIMVLLVGFLVTVYITGVANATGNLTGAAATTWLNFLTMVWAGFGLLSLFPIIMIGMSLISMFGGRTR